MGSSRPSMSQGEAKQGERFSICPPSAVAAGEGKPRGAGEGFASKHRSFPRAGLEPAASLLDPAQLCRLEDEGKMPCEPLPACRREELGVLFVKQEYDEQTF